jgi:hypothetical protein
VESKLGRDKLMDNAILHRRRLVVLTLAVALALAVALVVHKGASAVPPSPADQTFTVRGVCDFPVRVMVTGKMKVIDVPGPDIVITAPGQHATLTNLQESVNRVTVNSAGPGRLTQLGNGDVLVVARGRNILYDPGEGIFLTIGKVRLTVAGGPGVGGDITILESHGRIINLCKRLA